MNHNLYSLESINQQDRIHLTQNVLLLLESEESFFTRIDLINNFDNIDYLCHIN